MALHNVRSPAYFFVNIVRGFNFIKLEHKEIKVEVLGTGELLLEDIVPRADC